VGTANLGGSVHNAARSHVPVLILAGLTPYTMEGELPGSRDSQVNSMQDIPDQHGLVRPYVKWSYDLRTGRNAPQVLRRSVQLAASEPRGPVYVTAAREVLAERVPRPGVPTDTWAEIEPTALPQTVLDEILGALVGAATPVVVTSAVGQDPAAVGALVELAERLGVGVVETVRATMNFPSDHPLHLGYDAAEVVPRADALLVLDSDSPWIPTRFRPVEHARIFLVDPDPLNEDIPLWYLPAQRYVRATGATAVRQLLDRLDQIGLDEAQRAAVTTRTAAFSDVHARQRSWWRLELADDADLGAAHVAAALADLLDEDAIVVNETITNLESVFRHLPRNVPGTFFANRGTSLGWSGGAALGIAMASPGRTVVGLVGDGSFHFTVPSSTYAVAEAYKVPFLTVILDNGGWNATKQNLLIQYPAGVAAATDRPWVRLPDADLAGLAGSFGAWTAHVRLRAELAATLQHALAEVKAGRPAVVQVHLPPISQQQPDTLHPGA
jgi:acetolactate synthase-1/2/3 large subunit